MSDTDKKTLMLVGVVAVLLVVLFWMVSASPGQFGGLGGSTDGLNKPGRITLKEGKDYKAKLITNRGDVIIDLYEIDAAYTVNNFVYLAEQDYYDGTKFFRVIQNFIIQGGDPNNDGTGGPGYTFDDEINNHKIVKGTVAMATTEKDANGGQFYIVTKEDQPHLDGVNTAFGEVIEGMDVVEAISMVAVEDNGSGEASRPIADIILEDVEIIIE